MGELDRWEILLMLVAGYVAVMSLTRMMMRRRDELVSEVQKQFDEVRVQRRREEVKQTKKNKEAA